MTDNSIGYDGPYELLFVLSTLTVRAEWEHRARAAYWDAYFDQGERYPWKILVYRDFPTCGHAQKAWWDEWAGRTDWSYVFLGSDDMLPERPDWFVRAREACEHGNVAALHFWQPRDDHGNYYELGGDFARIPMLSREQMMIAGPPPPIHWYCDCLYAERLGSAGVQQVKLDGPPFFRHYGITLGNPTTHERDQEDRAIYEQLRGGK